MTWLLVDSSVWIQCFSKRPDPHHVQVIELHKQAATLATCDMVRMEVLRGARDKREFVELSDEFSAMQQCPIDTADWRSAEEMGHLLAKKGIHPPGADLLIATTVLRRKHVLLHRDRHYTAIAKHFPLKIM